MPVDGVPAGTTTHTKQFYCDGLNYKSPSLPEGLVPCFQAIDPLPPCRDSGTVNPRFRWETDSTGSVDSLRVPHWYGDTIPAWR